MGGGAGRLRPERRRAAGGELILPRLTAAFDTRPAEAALAAADPEFGAAMRRVGRVHRPAADRGTPFEMLLRSITYQQLSGRAAATIHGRLCALYPRQRPTPQAVLATPAELLRSAGLSRAKVAAAHDLAARVQDGTVPATTAGLHRLGEEEIIARLCAVRGVGRWTVEMFLMFRLGRPDILPVSDLGVQKGFAVAFRKRKLPTPAQLARRGERWRPWRTVASWYLWALAELGPE